MFLIEKCQEGGLQEGEGPRGREGVCGELGNWGGGKYFFRGRNVHQDQRLRSRAVGGSLLCDTLGLADFKLLFNFAMEKDCIWVAIPVAICGSAQGSRPGKSRKGCLLSDFRHLAQSKLWSTGGRLGAWCGLPFFRKFLEEEISPATSSDDKDTEPRLYLALLSLSSSSTGTQANSCSRLRTREMARLRFFLSHLVACGATGPAGMRCVAGCSGGTTRCGRGQWGRRSPEVFFQRSTELPKQQWARRSL